MSLPFPDEGEVYDYKLDDAGISKPLQDEDEEEEHKHSKVEIAFDDPMIPMSLKC